MICLIYIVIYVIDRRKRRISQALPTRKAKETRRSE